MDASTAGTDPMPRSLTPMAATPSVLPADESGWGFEIKWDGVRAVAFCDRGAFRLTGRTGSDFTKRYPEVGGLAEQLGSRRAVLDGEIVAFDDDGRPSFQRLQPRIHVSSDADVRERQRTIPVVYVMFDLLYDDGRSLLALGYEDRRRELEALGLGGPHWQVPAYHPGEGRALLEATRTRGLEGIIAKRLASRYRPGKRTRDWLKIKNVRRQEVVIGGWVAGKGRLSGGFGALLVGYYDDGQFRYAGKVGTGFDRAARDQLQAALDPLRRADSPFAGRQPQSDAVFVEPRLVCEVEFAEWTSSGTLRHPSYEGLRDDKDPTEVVREDPQPPPDAE